MTDLGPVINDIVENAGRERVLDLLPASFGTQTERNVHEAAVLAAQLKPSDIVQNIGENRSRDAHG